MNIVIFEDIPNHREFMIKTIGNYIKEKSLKAVIEICTDDIEEIRRYIRSNKIYTLYFIDIMDSQDNPVGLKLAEEIKEQNQADIVVFITQYLKEVIYSTEHKVIALNIIPKSKTAKLEICKSIDYAYSKTIIADCLVIDGSYGDTFKVKYDDIYMIESVKGCHKVRIHYHNGTYECAGLLKELKLDSRFNRCHRSYIINTDKVEYVSSRDKVVTLSNGLKAHYSTKYGNRNE